MDFTNEFTVAAPLERVWQLMMEVEEIVPCVPGAELTEVVDDNTYRGAVKVKVGPVSLRYAGEVQVERDADVRTIMMRARGNEVRGVGRASAHIKVSLSEQEEGTRVLVDSHVELTGRVAQFGRGLVQDVANRSIRQFAECLEEKATLR